MLHRDYIRYVYAAGVSILFVLASYLYVPVLAPYLKQMGFTDWQLGLLFATSPLAIVIFAPIAGRLSDKTSRVKLLLVGVILEITAILLFITQKTLAPLVAAKIISAIATSTFVLVALAKIEDTLKEKERGKYSGISIGLANAGMMVAPFAGALLAYKFSIITPFYFAIPLLVLVLFILLGEREKGAAKLDYTKDFNFLREIKKFWSHRELRGVAVVGLLIYAVSPISQIFLPLLIIEELKLSYAYIGYAFLTTGLAMLSIFYFGKLSDRIGRPRLILWGAMICGIALLLVLLAKNFLILGILLAFYGIGMGMMAATTISYVSDYGEKYHVEGKVMGSYISIAYIGAFISTALSGIIVSYFGMHALFSGLGVVVIIGALFAKNALREIGSECKIKQ